MEFTDKIQSTSKIKLDLKDKKILRILSDNSRTPSTQIAKQVGLSRDSVEYRIKNYEKSGLIEGYRTLVNIHYFGYINYHLFIKLNNPSQKVESNIIKKLVNIPNIRALLRFNGNFDYEIALICKDISELDDIITKIHTACEGFLQYYEILPIVKNYVVDTFPPNFSESLPYKKIKHINHKVDKKDIDILKILGENAKTPYYEIAEKVRLSADAVSYRVKKMIDAGIIIKFIPSINHRIIGYEMYAILLNINFLDEKKEKQLVSFLKNDPNILWGVKTLGKYNLLSYVLVHDINDFHETLLNLRKLFPKDITRYEALINFDRYKYVYFPKDLF